MTGARIARRAGEIGQGLAPARAARPVRAGERIHVVGAAGAGASAAALLASLAGARVTGCDAGGASPYTLALEAVGVPVTAGHDPAHVTDGRAALVDRLAVTKALTAVAPDHPELKAARTLGVPLEPWQQVVADVASGSGARLVAVAGTHGKSTSAGWLAALLAWAGRDPSAFVGALLPAWLVGGIPATARLGRGAEFVVEADEYAGNFDPYRPALTILLNADWDHPDVFADREAVVAAFETWIRRSQVDTPAAPASAAAAPQEGVRSGTVLDLPVLVANVGDPGAAQVAAHLADWPGRLVAVALMDDETDSGAHSGAAALATATALRGAFRTAAGPARVIVGRVVSRTISGTALEVVGLEPGIAVGLEAGGPEPVRVRLALPGRHNAQNALAVAGAAAALGVARDSIVDGLRRFEGVGRRLEVKGEVAGVTVLDDYGHHPTAIAATLAAVRQRYPGRRVWAVYEPLTFHRTAAMLGQFADVLATADEAVIAAIWAGRDPDTSIVSAADLAAAVSERGGPRASAPGDVDATADFLARRVLPGDVVLVMGGGRSYRIADRLVATLRGAA